MDEKMKTKWYSEGVRFECQGSGNCCKSRGEYGFVYLTFKDRQRFAKFFKIPTRAFTNKYCGKTKGYFHLKLTYDKQGREEPNCLFLVDNKCSVYQGRPMQCRTWPFWPEVMNPKVWKEEVIQFCPGIGKGKLYKEKEIEALLKKV
jgi:uncharacterized protein